ncbi:MAG: hypothetical protein FWH46_03030 [Methanimicrococcus sp.]|nr:hypothetical protein [Methanimicrococcus sp.]
MPNSNQKYVSIAIILLIAMAFVVPTSFGATANQTYYGDLGSNYYSFYGSPDIHASVQGTGEYNRGESSVVSIVLSNKGVLEGFKTETEVKGTGANEQLNATLQKMEVENIAVILDAVGITATLESNVSGITVKTGPQEAGNLKSGSTTSQPLKYTLDIQKDVPAGDYELTLKVAYKHLNNVIFSGDPIVGLGGSYAGVKNLNASYWYNENVTREIPIKITIKQATQFEIVNVEHSLSAGSSGMLYVTYKNSGEEPAKNAVVRLSTATPFSTTDDQSHLGTVNPGETAVAKFRISVAKDTVVYDKLYAINSEILYEDNYGHQTIAGPQKVEVTILEEPFFNTQTILILIAAAIILIAGGAYIVYKKRQSKKQG